MQRYEKGCCSTIVFYELSDGACFLFFEGRWARDLGRMICLFLIERR
ncbi:hypothetical protein GCWU000325_02464 [Alloprevotella tannerae ATCC 51259]|uniref:Uncharacterized protein n=1 Tax=Alloprevotella tannerae ATCC 51259 TaxID=626522 RepID=C9LJQ1_9BACT|nr:hypothetical protein GCWU000325_02464 [Alloprevotella tannerae ATCC 51259]